MANVIFLRKGDRHTYPIPRTNYTVGKIDTSKLGDIKTVRVEQLFKQ